MPATPDKTPTTTGSASIPEVNEDVDGDGGEAGEEGGGREDGEEGDEGEEGKEEEEDEEGEDEKRNEGMIEVRASNGE